MYSRDTFASQYDSDQEQWDEPLQRRTTAKLLPKRTVNQPLINVPFCRDPTQTIPVLAPIEEKRQLATESPRPTIYKKKPTANYQPPTPWQANQDDSKVIESITPTLRKTSFSKSIYGVDVDMQAPIRELQALAKSVNNLNEDDPPFNFQAMLKKTPRNRASMKRDGETDMSILENKCAAPRHVINPRKGPAPPTPKNNKFMRSYSRDRIKAALKNTDSIIDNCVPIIDDNRNEKIQIAPGITVLGTVIDL